jgi:sec-independent protein translocase protein TatB
MLSFGHMAVIFLVVLVVLGPEKLPQVARIMGKVMGDFRRITTDFRSQIEDEMREVERATRMKEQAAAAAAAAAVTQSATAQATPQSTPTNAQPLPQQGVPGTEPNGTRVSPGTPYDAPQESPQQATHEADQAASVLSRENPAEQPEPAAAGPTAVEVAPPDPKNPDDERYHSF